MSSFTQVIYEKQEGIAWITLNRPESMNSLTVTMLNEIYKALVLAGKDEDVRVVVVTGAGKAFCAGLDLKSLGATQIEHGAVGPVIDDPARLIINTIKTLPKPVIAMVNGACITGGLELTNYFDLIVASDKAKFGDTHARWGLRPSWGLSQIFPRRIGLLKAKELTFTARLFSAAEAEQIGLVNKVVPADKLKEEVKNLAKSIMLNSAEAIAAIKSLYNQGMALSEADGLKLEFESQFDINDTNERLKDFLK
jgi:enoyl-CoA hydratase